MATTIEPHRLNIINRDSFSAFRPSPQLKYPIKRRIVAVRPTMVDHEEKYREAKEKGFPVDITNSEIFVNGNQKPDDGIFSAYFGSDTTQERPYYSCLCQATTGGSRLGDICPVCGKPVVAMVDGDLRRTMYIDIAPYHILTYRGVRMMSKALKRNSLDDIIHSVKRIGKSGKIIDDGKPAIMDLYDDYEEKYEPIIGIERRFLFTSKIPVYSARLRPLMQFGMQMTVLDVNKAYLSIVKNRDILKTSPLFHNEPGVEIQKTLNQIQQDYIKVTTIVEGLVNGKPGVYRKSLASGRIDYTSRMVISLGIDLMPHEIDVPYQTMMILYEEEIANMLSTLEGISIAKAISLVEEHAMIRDERFVKIIRILLNSKSGVWALINRNPTISESSILYVRIRDIHEDGEDMTMHLPPDILELMAADFDGDQESYLANKDPVFHHFFMTMCPTYTFIDRATGKFNRGMGFKREYIAMMSHAWEIDQLYDRYNKDPEAVADEMYSMLGIQFGDTTADDAYIETLKLIASVDSDNKFRKRFFGGDLGELVLEWAADR